MAPGLRGLRAGADRQRGLGAVPTRCLRRGHVGPVRLGPQRGRAEQGRLGAADAAGRLLRDRVERARRRDLGGARPAPPLHALQGDGLGGGRPGRQDAGGVARTRRAPGGMARAAPRDLHRGVREGLQREDRLVHPVLRLRPARRQCPHDPAGGIPAAHGPPGDQHGRGGREGAARQRVRPALPHRRRRRHRRADRPRGRLPGLLVLVGRLPAHDRADRGRPGAVRAPAGAAQRSRPALRGVRRHRRPAGRQLPPGLLPRVAGQLGLPPDRSRRAGHRARGARPRRRRIVDHTVSLLPAMSRPPKRKRPNVTKRRSAATG